MEETIFGACRKTVVDPVESVIFETTISSERAGQVLKWSTEIAAAFIQAIIDRTPSPATVVELTRILREGGVEVSEATFD